MHIECTACGALFDEDENVRCPKCQTPVDEAVACGGCGSCTSNNGCGCRGGSSNSHGCETCGGCGKE